MIVIVFAIGAFHFRFLAFFFFLQERQIGFWANYNGPSGESPNMKCILKKKNCRPTGYSRRAYPLPLLK
jgi:hypothetical protein